MKFFPVLLLAGICRFATGQAPPPHDWENPQLSGINTEALSAVSMVYADSATAVIGNRMESPYFQLLNRKN
jgi:hypothetical protein